MARIKVALPQIFSFVCTIPVRVTDINYGGHAGNDSLLGMIHEARVQFLDQLGYTEFAIEGAGLIMTDVAIEFKNEVFRGDTIFASVAAGDFHRAGFDLYYLLEKEADGKRIPVVYAKTGMICFDYTLRKVMAVPQAAVKRLQE
ncbi:acyl-CoA thioesterase [Niabella soli]|uniref:Thioesterase n=1 Tax=Niabella soli DSM 19437 TaxID=929713 RepID=W0F1W8_9BACT|nr:thioesterase family protein [Niabella soli]AHF15321.1 thioesterase [Niabella soli DSM 19437]